VNTRLFAADELFFHRDLVDLATSTNTFDKKTKRLTSPVFAGVCGPLFEVANSEPIMSNVASTGWLSYALRRRIKKLFLFLHSNNKPPYPQRDYPWFSHQSWIDYGTFYRCSSVWASVRKTACNALGGMEILGDLLTVHPGTLIKSSPHCYGWQFNTCIVCLALYFEDRLQAREQELQHGSKM